MDWNLVSYVRRSKYRCKILQALQKEPLMAVDIAAATGLKRTNVNKGLQELLDLDMVKLLSEYRPRVYAITDHGKQVIKWVNEKEKTLSKKHSNETTAE